MGCSHGRTIKYIKDNERKGNSMEKERCIFQQRMYGRKENGMEEEE